MIVDFFEGIKKKHSVIAQSFSSLPPLRDRLCHRNYADGVIWMAGGVCNDKKVQVLPPPAPGWWRAACGSAAQLLLVGRPPAKWVSLVLWPEAKTMLTMLAPQVNCLRGGRGPGHAPDGWARVVALLKNSVQQLPLGDVYHSPVPPLLLDWSQRSYSL